MAITFPTVADRAYRDDAADVRRLHHLLSEAHRLTGRWRGWTPDRLDGFLRRCWAADEGGPAALDEIHVWEAPDGSIVGAVHPEDPDEAWVEVHPAWERIVPELLSWAEERHRARHAGEQPMPPLFTYHAAGDDARRAVLEARGYRERRPVEVLRRQRVPADPERPVLPPGYRLAWPDVSNPHDRRELTEITARVFNVHFSDRAMLLEERWQTPHARIAAETADGTYAAWCGVWAAPELQAGFFEPVGTHPDHRRRGLATAVMQEGLAWMRARGVRDAHVGTGATMDANRLYAGLGFRIFETTHQWTWAGG
jgi:GNAT superfamily N-acetyltransferase